MEVPATINKKDKIMWEVMEVFSQVTIQHLWVNSNLQLLLQSYQGI